MFYFEKFAMKNFSNQVSCEILLYHSSNIELPDEKYIAECKRSLQFCLQDKCRLY